MALKSEVSRVLLPPGKLNVKAYAGSEQHTTFWRAMAMHMHVIT